MLSTSCRGDDQMPAEIGFDVDAEEPEEAYVPVGDIEIPAARSVVSAATTPVLAQVGDATAEDVFEADDASVEDVMRGSGYDEEDGAQRDLSSETVQVRGQSMAVTDENAASADTTPRGFLAQVWGVLRGLAGTSNRSDQSDQRGHRRR